MEEKEKKEMQETVVIPVEKEKKGHKKRDIKSLSLKNYYILLLFLSLLYLLFL